MTQPDDQTTPADPATAPIGDVPSVQYPPLPSAPDYSQLQYGQPQPGPQYGAPYVPPAEVSIEQRRHALAMAISSEVARGGRVESQTDTNAIVVTGSKVNHVLHLIITLFTCGFWAIVWIILAFVQKEHRTAVSIDPYGQVLRQTLT
ncbi:hypothetical protein O4215_20585 [Rhodococcus maanshanensis]|uniref:hypothetical protein n=1 Tax=Rhodococcus maanshanensis TaxID=183556 RepID=UPI0022B41BBC|nr:hypothetical protein [Rhodococcus maanshanensis]MCZ4557962.1 hypothetical protein [Rhodococcus maanshanensis]